MSNRADFPSRPAEKKVDLIEYAHFQALRQLLEGEKPYQLTINDALQFYEYAKRILSESEFNNLTAIMRDCRVSNPDAMLTLSKVSKLLNGYPNLLRGFGIFLPATINVQWQMQISHHENLNENTDSETQSDDCMMETDASHAKTLSSSIPSGVDSSKISAETVRRQIQFECATNYLTKVKKIFQSQPLIFNRFVELLRAVQQAPKDSKAETQIKVYSEVCTLFKSYDDLIEEFKPFVPYAFGKPHQQSSPETANSDSASQSSTTATMDTSQDTCSRPTIEIQSGVCHEPIKKETSDSCNSATSDSPADEVNSDETDSADDVEDMMYYSMVADPSIASVYKYGAFEEHKFFHNVRKVLGYPEVYDNFLRCLMLFNEDVITRSELVKMAENFFGKYPALIRQLRDMLGFTEFGEDSEPIPMRILDLENRRKDHEVDLDIDYITGGRHGASYRALPKDQEQPKCSGRTQLCKEVLNDIWVSFPSWSEDSTFATSCKTQFEEIMCRQEDERFELDMAIKANEHTLEMLENLQKKINKMTQEERNEFSLDDTLGGTSSVLHQKALHRLYGDKTDDLVEGLKRNPVVAVPIIIKRGTTRQNEMKQRQEEYNQIWRQQIDKYYLKSLDHQGINFKQMNCKSFRTKTLVQEMDMVYTEKKNSQVYSSRTPHFILKFKEMSVITDAANLMCKYLKKMPGVYRDDRRKIELLIRSFITDFFGLPRETIIQPVEIDDDEEETKGSSTNSSPMETEEMENEEGQSGPTSPSGSGPDEGSDQEDSSSAKETSDKNFVEESDIFDKMELLLSTNMPYTLFYVNKIWCVFFRQFHILCERLSRLLFESTRNDVPVQGKKGDKSQNQPSYSEMLEKLTDLLTGKIEYSQFEELSRNMFGIHAFVSFTIDKLVSTINRQLQQVVVDDVCKQTTSFFFEHTKLVSYRSYVSPVEASQAEYQYWKKVEKVMDDEECYKILWLKKDNTLTIELMRHNNGANLPDPYETEKWSHYLDSFISSHEACQEILDHSEGLPVFLARNLRKQQKYWSRKVEVIKKMWEERHSPSFIKRGSAYLLKRKLQSINDDLSDKRPKNEVKDEPSYSGKLTEGADIKMESDPESSNDSINQESKIQLCNDKIETEDIKVRIDEDRNNIDVLIDEIIDAASSTLYELIGKSEDSSEQINLKMGTAMEEKKVVTMVVPLSEEKAGTTMEEKKAGTTMEEKKAGTMDEKKAGIMEEKKAGIMEEKKAGIMDEKKAETTKEEKEALTIMEEKKAETIMEEKKAETIMEEKKAETTMEGKKAVTTVVPLPEEKETPPEFPLVEEQTMKQNSPSNLIRIDGTQAPETKTDNKQNSILCEDQSVTDLPSPLDEGQTPDSSKTKHGDKDLILAEDTPRLNPDSPLPEDEKQESPSHEGGDGRSSPLGESQTQSDSGSAFATEQQDESSNGSELNQQPSSEDKSTEDLQSSPVNNDTESMEIEESQTDSLKERSDGEGSLEFKQTSNRDSPDIFDDIDYISDIDLAIKTATQVIETISSDCSRDSISINDSGTTLKEESEDTQKRKEQSLAEDKDSEESHIEIDAVKRERIDAEDHSEDDEDFAEESASINKSPTKARKARYNQPYVKRRVKKVATKHQLLLRQRRRKQQVALMEEFFENMDFVYEDFSELSNEEKSYYLATLALTVQDDTQCAFRQLSFKMYFVQGCNSFMYRRGSLTKAKENHQAVSEIKTLNFTAWHKVWLERYCNPTMAKFCNDWFLRDDPEKYKVFCIPVSSCTKPPYLPYNKYKLRYYKKKQ